MDPIVFEGTQKKPSINFDHTSGIIRIEGRSVPEDSIKFYGPLVNWIAEYRTNPQKVTEVHIQLDYFNTSSSKCLTDIFKEIEELYKDGHDVTLHWYYCDEYILEAGEDYHSFIKVPWKMIEIV